MINLQRYKGPLLALAGALLITCAPRLALAQVVFPQAVSTKPSYRLEEIFEMKDDSAGSESAVFGTGLCFAVSPQDDICVYSNSSNRLYLMDLKGSVLKKLDFREYNYSGRQLKISSIGVSEKGAVYLFDAENSKIICVSKDFKINNFYSKNDIFANDYILPPVDIYFGDNGNLLVYQRLSDKTSFFSQGELTHLKTVDSRILASGGGQSSQSYYAIKAGGSTLEITLNGPEGVKPFKKISYDGFVDGLFMAEKSPDGSIFIGARILNNDIYGFHILQLNDKSQVKSNSTVKTAGVPLTRAVLASKDRLLTVLPGVKNAGGMFLTEIKKITQWED